MSNWLTDKEKIILFEALSREKEVCKKVDFESFREPYEESIESVCRSLEYKFMYDRLFRLIEENVKKETIEECTDKFAEIMSNMNLLCGRSCPVNCWENEGSCNDRCKKWILEQLKERNNV